MSSSDCKFEESPTESSPPESNNRKVPAPPSALGLAGTWTARKARPASPSAMSRMRSPSLTSINCANRQFSIASPRSSARSANRLLAATTWPSASTTAASTPAAASLAPLGPPIVRAAVASGSAVGASGKRHSNRSPRVPTRSTSTLVVPAPVSTPATHPAPSRQAMDFASSSASRASSFEARRSGGVPSKRFR